VFQPGLDGNDFVSTRKVINGICATTIGGEKEKNPVRT
jgi:hypothetical protein